MPDARVIQVCDAIVANIVALWAPVSPDGVEQVFEFPFGDPDSGTIELLGRQVYVFPSDWGRPETASREENVRDHTVTLVVAERYIDGPAPVPKPWLRARVYFVEQIIWAPVGDPHQPEPLPGVWQHESVVEVCSLDYLNAQKLFLSVVNATLREVL